MTPPSFEILTRLMVAAAIAIVVIPLIARREGRRVWPSATAAALFIYLGSALAYPYLSNWTWPTASGVAVTVGGSPAALRAAAETTPQDPEGWARLALALVHAERTAEAAQPLQKVYELTGGSDADLSMLLVDALMMSSDANRPRVNALIEEILQRAPTHPKALYYGAELAFSRQDFTLARSRWQQLLARAQTDDSDEARRVRALLERRIAALDEAPVVDTHDDPAQVVVEVTLTAALAGRVNADDPLFILARVPGEPGPPVAVVRRRAGDLPVTVVLSDANAMLATRKLSQFPAVEVVARIARGGTPTAQPGDLYGRATAKVEDDGAVSITIAEIEQ